MNQILSISMPQKQSKIRKQGKKASTESIVKFFSIVLLVFGILLVLIGIYSMINNKGNDNNSIVNVQESELPQIYIIQNASELEIEISAKNEISKIQYRWNDGEIKEESGNGTNNVRFNIQVPSGENTFKIKVKDVNENINQYSKQYIGDETQDNNQTQNQNQTGNNQTQNQSQAGNSQTGNIPNVSLSFNGTNNLKILCEEEKIIKTIAYYYDNEEPTVTNINDKKGTVENIPIKQGKHSLTVKVTYEDNTEKKKTDDIYFPIIEKAQLTSDGNGIILKASDEMKISKVVINVNGEKLPEENVNNTKYEKTINQLKQGENRIIFTVYNSKGLSITKGIKYEKK